MLSSYNRFHNNVFRDIWIIGIVDLITSVFMTSLLFAAVGFVCHELDISYDQFKLQGTPYFRCLHIKSIKFVRGWKHIARFN